MAVLLTWALFFLFAAVGLGVLKLARHRWSLVTLLLAPAVGLATVVTAVYVLVRLEIPVGVSALPVAAALGVLVPAALWRFRPSAARARELWRRGRWFALILVATFGLTAWPMFGYGFDWVANANDDMANYCVMATGYRDHGYATIPSAAELRAGTDHSQAFWFSFRLREARQGSEVLLALVSAWTGRAAVDVFMPVIVALNLALIAAAAGLVAAGTRRPRVAAATALLMAVSSQTTYGVVQQLIAQAGGLALLCTALALVTARFRRLPTRLVLRRAGATGVVFAGMTVFYPEVIPLLVGACVVLGVRDLVRGRLDRRHLLHAGTAIAVMTALLPLYVVATARFILLQGTAGARSTEWVKEVFPYHLTPRAGAVVWGLLPFAGPESPRFQTAAVLAGLALAAAVAVPALTGLRRGRVTAATFAVCAALWAALSAQGSAFGLFKLAMFLQPFLWATVAVWALSRRSRWSLVAACVLVAVIAGQNARVQFWFVDQSRGRDCRVALPAVSSRHGLEEFRADYARQAAQGVDRVLVASDNLVLTKLVVAEVRGVPTGIIGTDPFDHQVRMIVPVMAGEPLARRHPEWAGELRALRAEFGADEFEPVGPVVRDPATGAVLHRLIAEQPERLGRPGERTLVVAPGGALTVLNRYRHPAKGPLVVCVPLAELRNFAVFCDATGARQHFLGMQDAAEIGLYLMEADSLFRKQTSAGVGRAVVIDVLNPSPRVRVLVNATGSYRADPAVRNAPRAEIVGDRRVPLGAVGVGAARLVSPPVAPQAAGPGNYLAIEFGDASRNPNRLGAAEALWGADLPRDRRMLAGHVRDISVLSEEEYAAFRPPQAVRMFPADLAHPHLEFSGFFEDGWVGTEATMRLTQSESDGECVIRGMVPGLAGAEGFRTELTVLIDGVPAERKLLGPGEFEVRAPAAAGAGPRWVELRFSNDQVLPAPDSRRVAAQVRSVGFEPKNEALARPPQQLAAFPADLGHPRLEHSGIFADGWCGASPRARLTQPAAGGEVVVRGQVPDVVGDGAFRTELVVLVDGAETARRPLGVGDFEVRAPVGKSAQARWVECRFTHTQTLPPPDGRSVGAHLRFVGFEPPRPGP